jgi:hypothetical protein
MPGYQNTPVYAFAPPLAPGTKPYFVAALVLFAVAFFVGIHWHVHNNAHNCPPMYAFKVQQWWRKLVGRS